jgi:hypothetical protein
MSVVDGRIEPMKTINITLTKEEAEQLISNKLTNEQWDYIATGLSKYINDYFTDEINYYLVEIQEDN